MNRVVTCYSGVRYAERPVALQYGGDRLKVDKILRTWREPDAVHFFVRTSDGRFFRLMYKETADRWWVSLRMDSAARV